MESNFDLSLEGITAKKVLRNAPPAKLYEEALRNETGSAISNTGALMVYSGKKQVAARKTNELLRILKAQKIFGGEMSIFRWITTLLKSIVNEPLIT